MLPMSTTKPIWNTTVQSALAKVHECEDLWTTLNVYEDEINDDATGDPDIAGTGVLIAFLAPAYLTWILATVAYLMGWVNKSERSTLDEKIRKALHLRNRTVSDRTESAVRKTVLLCSDLQIIAGLGILIAAFSRWNIISVYHYQVAAYLAWMSSNVHLTTMTILREHLQKNTKVRFWRVGAMIILLIFLVIALIPTVSKSWAWLNGSSGFSIFHVPKPHSGASVPAKCFWRKRFTQEIDAATIMSYFILAFMYIWKVALLYEPSERFLHKWLRAKPQYYLEKAVAHARQDGKNFGYKLRLGSFMLFVALADFCESFMASLWMLGISMVWGSLRVLATRMAIPAQVRHDEKKVTFGQVLPIFLLFLPLMTLAEKLFSK